MAKFNFLVQLVSILFLVDFRFGLYLKIFILSINTSFNPFSGGFPFRARKGFRLHDDSDKFQSFFWWISVSGLTYHLYYTELQSVSILFLVDFRFGHFRRSTFRNQMDVSILFLVDFRFGRSFSDGETAQLFSFNPFSGGFPFRAVFKLPSDYSTAACFNPFSGGFPFRATSQPC